MPDHTSIARRSFGDRDSADCLTSDRRTSVGQRDRQDYSSYRRQSAALLHSLDLSLVPRLHGQPTDHLLSSTPCFSLVGHTGRKSKSRSLNKHFHIKIRSLYVLSTISLKYLV